MKRYQVCFLVIGFPIMIRAQTERWVWHYQADLQRTSPTKKEQTVVRVGIPPFNQFLFCWNALRPSVGYFSFQIKTRDAATQRWGRWHTMAAWGNNMQQSYLSDSDGMSKYVHVRLEMEPPHRADAFAIKVTAHDGANLALIKRLFGTAIDYDRFKPEAAGTLCLPSCTIDGVPQLAQLSINHTQCTQMCSPTSSTMLAGYLTGKQYDPLEFALKSYDHGLQAYGSWPFNVAHAFDACSGAWYYFNTRLNSFRELHAYLQRSLPVVVSVRGYLPGALKPFNNGHLLLVVGYDADKHAVVCHDPAAYEHADVVKKYPLEDFIRAWERSRRLAYVATAQ
jgi:hypothetical protein